VNRDGINIGEGACLTLMMHDHRRSRFSARAPVPTRTTFLRPTRRARARDAMARALSDAAIAPEHIDYINLHGTGTPLNDSMECRAIAELFGTSTPCSSTKPLIGHTLGAAGALELGLCWLAMSELNSNGYLPPHRWDQQPDPDLAPLEIVAVGSQRRSRARICLSNSFAFGGNNASLVIGRFD
jgi:3-oxoacyl-[acyl-carrier-protein] synthase-1